MIEIDGSQGEGGGQIVRSSLALGAVTGKAFEIRNIRAGRKKPGLLKQHLTAVRAAREICGGDTDGDELYSQSLIFCPGAIQSRDFVFKVGTAGSASLVAQTVLPALMIAERVSSIEVHGGTHNMAAPPFHFLESVYLPLVSKLGPKFQTSIASYGFFPVGGGEFKIEIEPCRDLASIELLERKQPMKPQVISLLSQLPDHIGQREVDVIRRSASWKNNVCEVREVSSPGPGNAVMIRLEYQNVTELFTGFGKQGVKAEQVARRVYRDAKKYMQQAAPVGDHLCDQLMLPLAIAAAQGKQSRFRTGPLTMHAKTHIDVIRMFLDVDITIVECEQDVLEIVIGPKQ